MYINNVTFTWKKEEDDQIDFCNIKKIDVTFDRENEKPLLVIDAGKIKIEDRSLEIESKDVLKKIGLIDFESVSKYDGDEYCGDVWELIVNDKKYQGFMGNPKFVNEIRKIIRLNAIQVYANKKLGNYLK